MTNSNGELSRSSKISRSQDPLSAQVGDEMVLMSIEKGNYYGLDTIATEIWHRVEHPIVVEDLCAQLADEYDAGMETIEKDVLALLAQFAQEGFIEIQA